MGQLSELLLHIFLGIESYLETHYPVLAIVGLTKGLQFGGETALSGVGMHAHKHSAVQTGTSVDCEPVFKAIGIGQLVTSTLP